MPDSTIAILCFALIIIFLAYLNIKQSKINKPTKKKEADKQQAKTILRQSKIANNNAKKKERASDQINELLTYTSSIELMQIKYISKIRYSNLLRCIDWKFKRVKILVRDNYTCQDCKNVSIN